MGVPAFQAVGVLGAQLPARPGGHPDHQGDVELPAGHVQEGSRVVHDLVQGQQAEVDRHDFHDGPHAAERRADARPHKAGFGQGRVADAFRPEFLEKSQADSEAAPVRPHVLTHEEHAFVALHGVPDAGPDGFPVGGFHCGPRSL